MLGLSNSIVLLFDRVTSMRLGSLSRMIWSTDPFTVVQWEHAETRLAMMSKARALHRAVDLVDVGIRASSSCV